MRHARGNRVGSGEKRFDGEHRTKGGELDNIRESGEREMLQEEAGR